MTLGPNPGRQVLRGFTHCRYTKLKYGTIPSFQTIPNAHNFAAISHSTNF
jgi:2-keto-3-deoxy-galactonokinase